MYLKKEELKISPMQFIHFTIFFSVSLLSENFKNFVYLKNDKEDIKWIFWIHISRYKECFVSYFIMKL